jgi:hypothetical protein
MSDLPNVNYTVSELTIGHDSSTLSQIINDQYKMVNKSGFSAVVVDLRAITFKFGRIFTTVLARKFKAANYDALLFSWTAEKADSSFAGIIALFDWDEFECTIPVLFISPSDASLIVNSRAVLSYSDNPEEIIIIGPSYIIFVTVLTAVLLFVLLLDSLERLYQCIKKKQFTMLIVVLLANAAISVMSLIVVISIQCTSQTKFNYPGLFIIAVCVQILHGVRFVILGYVFHECILSIYGESSSVAIRARKTRVFLLSLSALLIIAWALLLYFDDFISGIGSDLADLKLYFWFDILWRLVVVSYFIFTYRSIIALFEENPHSQQQTSKNIRQLRARLLRLIIYSAGTIITSALFLYNSDSDHLWISVIYLLFFTSLCGILHNKGFQDSFPNLYYARITRIFSVPLSNLRPQFLTKTPQAAIR